MSLFALLVSLLLPAPTTTPLANFDLRLEREGREWRVTCATGCAFTQASVTCENECPVIISSRGVQTQRSAELSSTEFAFIVTPQENGWKAESLHGTRWRELGATCSPTCRTRINEIGVSVR